MKRNEFLDYSKGILISLVVIGHAIQFVAYQNNYAIFFDDPFFKLIYIFHMPLFMAISGYLSFNTVNKSKFSTITVSKTKSYIVPIFVWSFAFTAARVALKEEFLIENFLSTYLKESLNALWFLWVLWACLLILVGIKRINVRKTRLVSLFLIAIITFATLFIPPQNSHVDMLQYMFPFFISGYLFSSREASFMRLIKYPFLRFLPVIVSILIYALWSRDTYIYTTGMSFESSNLPNILLRYVGGYSLSIMFLQLLHILFNYTPKFYSDHIKKWGSASIYIYILQTYFFVIAAKLSHSFFPMIENSLVSLLMSLLIGVPVTALCWLIGSYISKNKVLALLLFGK